MPRVAPRKLSHIVYRTHRYEQMIAWYTEVFGARLTSKGPVMTFMTFDDEDHRFAFANLDALKPAHDAAEAVALVGVDHVAYTLDSIGELLGNYEHLKSRGIEPYWCIHHGITVSLYYADPDGNQMEFQVETRRAQPPAPADAPTLPRINNPVGVEFDPADWLRRLHGGTPEGEFLVRSVHEPISPIRGAIERA